MRQMKGKKAVELQEPDATQNEHPQSAKFSSARRKRDPILQLAQGNCDREALNSLVSEWLVPLLVREFLAEQQMKITVNSNDPTSSSVTEEGAGFGRIR